MGHATFSFVARSLTSKLVDAAIRAFPSGLFLRRNEKLWEADPKLFPGTSFSFVSGCGVTDPPFQCTSTSYIGYPQSSLHLQCGCFQGSASKKNYCAFNRAHCVVSFSGAETDKLFRGIQSIPQLSLGWCVRFVICPLLSRYL